MSSSPHNGQPALFLIAVGLDHNIPLTYHRHNIKLFVPAEFATLLEAGLPITVTLEQNSWIGERTASPLSLIVEGKELELG
jgi:hypothetical protein